MNELTGIELIAAERQRQIEEEGWTKESDSDYVKEELVSAARAYATPVKDRGADGWVAPDCWPWALTWWKPCPDDRVRELVKAGALIAAEIDRLNAIEK